MRHTRHAFTLIELLVSIGIIILLLGILLAFVTRSRREARLPACMENQKQIFNALKVFCDRNTDASDACPGSCGTVPAGGPGATKYYGVGQLTTVTDTLRQQTLEKTSRSALLVRNYLSSSAAFHCPEQEAQLPYEMSICGASANFQYVFNQYFVGDKPCNPAQLVPVYSSATFPHVTSPVTFARAGNPSRCVLITEDGLLTDSTPETKVGTDTFLHASPMHRQREHKAGDLYPYTNADAVVCTFVDGHAEPVTVDTSKYLIPSDHTGLPR